MALNIVVQHHGAHSCTIPSFIEILGADTEVFYPSKDTVVSDEQAITQKYGTRFHKSAGGLVGRVQEVTEHGVLVFNSSNEMTEEWAQPVIDLWHGSVLAYHHETTKFADAAHLVQVFAHPFADPDAYMLPVSSVFEDMFSVDEQVDRPTIVIPNWSRPSHLQNKNIALLAATIGHPAMREFEFVLAGMSVALMEQVVDALPPGADVCIKSRLNVETLARLISRDKTFVWPLINPAGRYATKGLTASIPHSLNLDCPLILSDSVAAKYRIQNYVNEAGLAGLASTMDSYPLLRAQVRDERRRHICRNRKMFTRLSAGPERRIIDA